MSVRGGAGRRGGRRRRRRRLTLLPLPPLPLPPSGGPRGASAPPSPPGALPRRRPPRSLSGISTRRDLPPSPHRGSCPGRVLPTSNKEANAASPKEALARSSPRRPGEGPPRGSPPLRRPAHGATTGEIKAEEGLPSADRNNKATLLLTGPFRTTKSSAKDSIPRVSKLQYASHRRALRARRKFRLLGYEAEAYSYTSTTCGRYRRVLAWILT